MQDPTTNPDRDYRLVALDMDGTLLTSQKRVSPGVVEAIWELDDHDLCATVATGRALREIEPLLDDLAPVRYAVLSNGAVVRDLWEGRTIATSPIPDEGVRLAIETGLEDGCVVQAFTADRAFFNKEDIALGEELALAQYMDLWARTNEPLGDPRTLVDRFPGQLTKLNLYHRTEEGRRRTRARLAEAGSLVQAVNAEGHSVEVTSPGTGKDTGVETLCGHLGITMGQVVAIGDGDNDYALLDAAGLGVAMANATPGALAHADVQTARDNDHDGVAEAIRRYFPI